MNIFVIGREGQLARCLAEAARDRADLRLIFAGRPDVDLEIPGQLATAIRAECPDVVINAAAFTAVDLAEDQPDRAFRINDEAAGEAAATAAACGARIIQVSTDYVFDGTSAAPYCEDDRPAPINVYGASKLAGEVVVQAANPDHCIVRTAWLYSPFAKNFVRSMLDLATKHDSISVVNDQRGNPTSASDLAAALLDLACLERDRLPLVLHVAGTGDASWAEFASAVMDCAGNAGGATARIVPIGSDQWPSAAKRPRSTVLDLSLATATLGHALPEWRASVEACVHRLVVQGTA